MTEIRTQITDRLALDPQLSTGGTHFASTAATAMPLDFSDGFGLHSVYQDIVPGGAIGPNGFVELFMTGTFSITANRTVTVNGPTSAVSSETLLGGSSFGFQGWVTVQNMNNEAVQRGSQSIVFGRSGGAAEGPYIAPFSSATDTTQDWSFSTNISCSSGSTIATVDFVRVLRQFIP